MTDTLTLHHLEYSQSFRVLWMLEELQAPYDLVVYDRDAQTMAAPDAYKALSPLGTAPVMTCGDLALSESSAIMEFILDRTPEQSLRPEPDSPDRTRYLFWWHAAQGSMMPLQLMKTVTTISQKRLPFFMKPFVKLLRVGLPKGAVARKMAEEGLDASLLDKDLDAPPDAATSVTVRWPAREGASASVYASATAGASARARA